MIDLKNFRKYKKLSLFKLKINKLKIKKTYLTRNKNSKKCYYSFLIYIKNMDMK